MRAHSPVGLGLAAVPLLWLAAGAVQQPTFRVGVNLVRVDVSVTRNLEPVSHLTAESFMVFDNGVKQKIERAIHEQVPLEAFLVLDVSGSMAEGRLEQLKAAVRAFVAGLTPQDKVALVTFAAKPTVQQALTGDLEALLRSLDDVKAEGQTALYDATALALTMRKPSDSRAVMVVLTDSGDNASNTSPKSVVQSVERSDAIVYGVSVGGGVRGPVFGQEAMRSQFQVGFLRSLADTTGGRVLSAEAGPRLADAFGAILNDVRARYLLTYYPDKVSPGWHKLEVKLNGVKGNVLARRGYYAGGKPESR